MMRGDTPSPPSSHRGFHSRLNQSKLGLKSFIERTLSPKTSTPVVTYTSSTPTATSGYSPCTDNSVRAERSGRICDPSPNGRSRSTGVHRRAFTTIFSRRHKTADEQSNKTAGDFLVASSPSSQGPRTRINERKKSSSCSSPTTAKTMPPETALLTTEDLVEPNFQRTATDRIRIVPPFGSSDIIETSMSSPSKVHNWVYEKGVVRELLEGSDNVSISEDGDCDLAVDHPGDDMIGRRNLTLLRRHTDNGGNFGTRTPNQITHLTSRFPFHSPANSILSEPSHYLDATPSPLNRTEQQENVGSSSGIFATPRGGQSNQCITVGAVVVNKLDLLTVTLKKTVFGISASGTLIDTAIHFKPPSCSKSLIEYYSNMTQDSPANHCCLLRRFTAEDLYNGSQEDFSYQTSVPRKALLLLGKKSAESTISTNDSLGIFQSPRGDKNEAGYHSEAGNCSPSVSIGWNLSKSVSHHAVCALITAFEEGFESVVSLFRTLNRDSLVSLLYFTPSKALLDEFWPEYLMFFSVAFNNAVEKFNQSCWQGLDLFKDLKICPHHQLDKKSVAKPSLPFQIAFLLLATPTITKDALQMFFNDSAQGRASLYWGNTHLLSRAVLVHYADLIDYSKMNFEAAFRTFINHFPLVGESQHIYFSTEAFARGYTLSRLKTNPDSARAGGFLVGDDSTLTMEVDLKELDDSSRLNSLLMGSVASDLPVVENGTSPRCRFSTGSPCTGRSPTGSSRKLCWLKSLQEPPTVSISASDLSVEWKLEKAVELEDTVLALAYAVVILNTSKHNQSLSRTKRSSITRQAFKQMVQAAAKYAVSESLLGGLYASISTCPLVATEYNHTYFNEKRISVQACTFDEAKHSPCEIEATMQNDGFPVPMIVNKLHRCKGRIQHRLIWINPADETVNWCSPLGILSPATRSLSRMRSDRRTYTRGDMASFESINSSKLHLQSPLAFDEEKLQTAFLRNRSPVGFKRPDKESPQRLFSPRETWDRSHSPENTWLGLRQSSKRSYTPPMTRLESDLSLEREKSAKFTPGLRSSSASSRVGRLEARRTSESKDWIGCSIVSKPLICRGRS